MMSKAVVVGQILELITKKHPLKTSEGLAGLILENGWRGNRRDLRCSGPRSWVLEKRQEVGVETVSSCFANSCVHAQTYID